MAGTGKGGYRIPSTPIGPAVLGSSPLENARYGVRVYAIRSLPLAKGGKDRFTMYPCEKEINSLMSYPSSRGLGK
jgi:hypothetical protein